MTELAKDSFTVPACGQQHDIKQSLPRWTFPKQDKDRQRKVYLSEKHQQDMLGKETPGPIYNLPPGKNTPQWTLSKAPRPGLQLNDYPDPSNDLIGALPDIQQVKFPNARRAVAGTSARAAPVNAPGLEGFAKGAISPGPQAYNPAMPSTQPKYTLRPRNDAKVLLNASSTPARVGPASYKHEGGCGKQQLKKTLPIWSFSKTPRFPTKISGLNRKPTGDDGDGKLSIKFKRSANKPPEWGMGTGTRDDRRKLGYMPDPAQSRLSHSASMPHPTYSTRREILKLQTPQK